MKLSTKLLIIGTLALLIVSCDSKKQKIDYSSEPTIIVTKAAEQGDTDAQCELGKRYANGEGVAQNEEEAIKLFTKAAMQEHADAQFNLAKCYATGVGVKQDYVEAAKWYRKAADQGHAYAQVWLGVFYENGKGVEKNEEEAAKWYAKAEKQDIAIAATQEQILNELNDTEFPIQRGEGVVSEEIATLPDYVDLGLSVYWATCNIGADSPEEHGKYYAWGEIASKKEYRKENSTTFGKIMGDIAGNSNYDAATANWGSPWRLPTRDEIQELITKCKWTWITQGKQNGYKITGHDGNSIFLPAAGCKTLFALILYNENGSYWGSLPDGSKKEDAYTINFNSENFGGTWRARDLGRSVRPVRDR